jgi:hypothetical protein
MEHGHEHTFFPTLRLLIRTELPLHLSSSSGLGHGVGEARAASKLDHDGRAGDGGARGRGEATEAERWGRRWSSGGTVAGAEGGQSRATRAG